MSFTRSVFHTQGHCVRSTFSIFNVWQYSCNEMDAFLQNSLLMLSSWSRIICLFRLTVSKSLILSLVFCFSWVVFCFFIIHFLPQFSCAVWDRDTFPQNPFTLKSRQEGEYCTNKVDSFNQVLYLIICCSLANKSLGHISIYIYIGVCVYVCACVCFP